MKNKLTLYVPDPNDGTLDSAVREYERFLSHLFGGCTTTEATGSWINGQGKLERERMTLITSYIPDESLLQVNNVFRGFVDYLLRQGQEAVMYTFNGEAFIHTEPSA